MSAGSVTINQSVVFSSVVSEPLTRIDVRLQVQSLTGLAVFSSVAQRVLGVVGNEDITVADFAHVIEQDPAMLARIIGVANAAYFGQREPITSAEKAIFNALGLRLAKNLVLAIALTGPFDTRRCPAFCPEFYWQTALLSAHFAQRLSRKVDSALRPADDDVYLAGLLHGFGLLALVDIAPEAMRIVFATTPAGDSLVGAERGAFDADHHEVGGWLARKWHIPENIIRAIEHAHMPAYRDADWPLVQVTGYAARWVTRHLAAREEAQRDNDDERSTAALKALGVDTQTRQAVAQDVLDRRKDILSLAQVFTQG